jgi:phosphotransferase system  glucose/maltose/N-acetylglucosamine-specific IIC component
MEWFTDAIGSGPWWFWPLVLGVLAGVISTYVREWLDRRNMLRTQRRADALRRRKEYIGRLAQDAALRRAAFASEIRDQLDAILIMAFGLFNLVFWAGHKDENLAVATLSLVVALLAFTYALLVALTAMRTQRRLREAEDRKDSDG